MNANVSYTTNSSKVRNSAVIAHKQAYKQRQTDTITVQPATTEQAEALKALAVKAYHTPAELAQDWFSTEEYTSRIERFPEGQFVAVDELTGEIVGMTSAMRFNFNPDVPFLENWQRTTGFG